MHAKEEKKKNKEKNDITDHTPPPLLLNFKYHH